MESHAGLKAHSYGNLAMSLNVISSLSSDLSGSFRLVANEAVVVSIGEMCSHPTASHDVLCRPIRCPSAASVLELKISRTT